jgi:hypothetical protein
MDTHLEVVVIPDSGVDRAKALRPLSSSPVTVSAVMVWFRSKNRGQ